VLDDPRWSAAIGRSAIGTPAASAASVVPAPPCVTNAAARASAGAIGTQRSTRTLTGSGPSSAGSAWRPIVTSARTGRSATDAIASR
jgi:hypothetical protein